MKTKTLRMAMGLGMLAAVTGPGAIPDPKPNEMFWAEGIGFPVNEQVKVFSPKDKQANFTFHDGVADWQVRDEALTFTLTTNRTLLGWGNYMGQQQPAEMADLWPEENSVVIKLKASAALTGEWTLKYWRDGAISSDQGINPVKVQTNVPANVWTNLVFPQPYGTRFQVIPDGFELEFAGPAGTRMEIGEVRVAQKVCEGYCRKEFELPAGKIWRAIADVGGPEDIGWCSSRIGTRLFINGAPVKRRGVFHLYCPGGVDIAPYLKPGKNAVGFYGYRCGVNNPFIYFQAKIVMESGEEIRWKTDKTWKYACQEQKGWNTVGFDDAQWANVVNDNNVWSGRYLPGESGRLRLLNPRGARLVYPDTGEVAVAARVPAGLKDKNPVLEYEFGRADADGQSTAVKSGEQKDFTTQDGSLIFPLNLGRQSRGVYTVALRLKGGDGAVIEERGREPVLVVGAVGKRAVAGTNDFDGLDVELEDTVDFTNPNDPHPSIEATTEVGKNTGVAVAGPLIVEKNGLKYRETRTAGQAFFAYRVEFKHPGSWYLLELEYPDDARRLTLAVIAQFVVGTASDSGVGAETGGRFYPTGRMQTLRWMYIAEKGPQAIYVANPQAYAMGEKGAAARGFKIYRVKGELPSLGGGMNREFGIHTERCAPDSGFARDFGTDPWRWLNQYQWKDMFTSEQVAQKTAYEEKASVTTRILRDLVWYQTVCERYTQYLKFTAQNTHVMGIYQYDEGNTGIDRPRDYATARVESSLKHVLAQVLEANGIGLYAGVEWSQFPEFTVRYQRNNIQVARGDDTVWMIDRDGKQFYGLWCTVVPNWLHPEIRKRFREYVAEITDHFGYLKHFRGVHFLGPSPTQGLDGYWVPAWTDNYADPLKYSYDDTTFALFAKDTGIKLPTAPNDPQRFQKRAALVQAGTPLGKQFNAWRCEKLKAFFAEALGVLQSNRKDLVWKNAVGLENPKFFASWLQSGQAYPDYLRNFGMDLALLDSVPDVWFGRWTLSWAHGMAQNPYLWLPKVDPRITGAYDQKDKRYVFCRTSWVEERAVRAGAESGSAYGYGGRVAQSDWITDTLVYRAIPQPAGYHAREAFIQALITGDPNMILYGLTDASLNVGHEQMLRSFGRILTHLPPERFATVLDTWLESNLAIRQLEKAGQTYLYVANPAYWTISGELTLAGQPKVKELVDGCDVALTQKEGHSVLPVTLEPYGLLAYRVAGTGVKVESYRTATPGEPELAFLRGIITRVQRLVKDETIKLALAPKDRAFVEQTLTEAQEAMEKGEYAKAWARVTGTQFWLLWQDFLEKAVKYMARLPEGTKTDEAEKKTADSLRVLTATRADGAIILDGKLDESAWGKTPFQTGFVTPANKPALAEVGLKAVYDDQAIYLGVICADKDVKALKAEATESDGIWSHQDDAIVLFIQPDAGQPVYYQFGFNTKGVLFHQKVKGGDRNYTALPGWKPAVTVGEKVWTAEVKLPYETFGLAGRGNGQWRLNVHRVFRNKQLDAGSWSYPGEAKAGGSGPWHNTERFGYLRYQ